MRLGHQKTARGQLVAVQLGAREAKEDWLELGRDLMTRGLAAPRLVVADGAPGLISAIGEIWPRADRQHCCVHRLRNLLAKLPKAEQDRVRFNYWAALTDAEQLSNVVDEQVKNHQAATFSSVVVVSSSVTLMPSLNFTPASTSVTSSWPLKRRQRSWAASSSL